MGNCTGKGLTGAVLCKISCKDVAHSSLALSLHCSRCSPKAEAEALKMGCVGGGNPVTLMKGINHSWNTFFPST